MSLLSRLSKRGFVVWDGLVYLLDRKKTLSDQAPPTAGFCVQPEGMFSLFRFDSIQHLFNFEKKSPLSIDDLTTLVKQSMAGSQSYFLSEYGSKYESKYFLLEEALVLFPHVYIPSKTKEAYYVEVHNGNKKLQSYFRHSCQRLDLLVGKTTKNQSPNAIAFRQVISIPLDAYVLESGYQRYLFDSTNLHLDVSIAEKITLLRPPYVQQGYENPYVFDSGNICFNGENRWKEKGIQFGIPLSVSDAVSQVASIFWETKSVLTNYFGTTQKVHPLEFFQNRKYYGIGR